MMKVISLIVVIMKVISLIVIMIYNNITDDSDNNDVLRLVT